MRSCEARGHGFPPLWRWTASHNRERCGGSEERSRGLLRNKGPAGARAGVKLQTQEVSCQKKLERSSYQLQIPDFTSHSFMSKVSGTGSTAKDILREPSTGSCDCLGTGLIGFTRPALPSIRSTPDTTQQQRSSKESGRPRYGSEPARDR